MHIKNSPVKGFKNDCAGFELDTSAVELHSAHKREILLPYTGLLPDALQNNDSAVISVMPTVNLRINVSLIVNKGKDKIRCLIAATLQEINSVSPSMGMCVVLQMVLKWRSLCSASVGTAIKNSDSDVST